MTTTTSIVQEIRDKAGITEEVEKQIKKMQSGTLGLSQSMDIVIPVTNGYGAKSLGPYSNPFPWQITVHATGWVENPQKGTWRILIKVNGNKVFDKSDIAVNQKFSASVSLKGWSASNVHVEAWWSEMDNTNLKVHVDGNI